jgi:hypothetical protein
MASRFNAIPLLYVTGFITITSCPMAVLLVVDDGIAARCRSHIFFIRINKSIVVTEKIVGVASSHDAPLFR